MNDLDALVEGLDESFWNALPSPIKPSAPRTPQPPRTPLKPTTTANNGGDIDMAEFLAGAEDWDLDATFTPIRPKLTSRLQPPISDPVTRCKVNSMEEAEHNGRWAKVLHVHVYKTQGDKRTIYLQDDWYDTDVQTGDVVNALGHFVSTSSSTPQICISSQSNMLVLHPDILLTATALSNAPQCRRKPMLSSLVRASNDISPAMVWGNMLHEVMQRCLLQDRWEEPWIHEQIDDVLLDGLDSLLVLGIGETTARATMRDKAQSFPKFRARYISDAPKPDAVLSDTRSSRNARTELLAITRVHEVEEDIWSPKYGLKGKLDVTVEAVVREGGAPALFPSPTTTGPRPFEIKTGKMIGGMEHRAQTMLYTLLASERYGVEVEKGLLFYSSSESGDVVPRGRNEIRGLIIMRNELAAWMMKRMRKKVDTRMEVDNPDIEEAFLPPPIDREHACKRCYVVDSCMLYRFALNPIEAPPTDPKLAETYESKTGHLTKEHAEFFRKWERLLSLEERDLVKFKSELWRLGAAEREKRGRCLAGMVMKDDGDRDQVQVKSGGKMHKFVYTFARSDGASLLNGHLSVGDAITVSVEPYLLAFVQGYILDIGGEEVRVGVDHQVDMQAIRERVEILRRRVGVCEEEVVFRIDKDELFGGMGRMRNNLAQLFYVDGDFRRRELVVDLREPRFNLENRSSALGMEATTHLNDSQKGAIEKVLGAEDYALVLGMPGTGKTTVVAALIRVLVARGKSVLLASYTHSAVDSILRKLGEGGEDEWKNKVLRLGNADKVHEDAKKYLLGARPEAKSVEELEKQWMAPSVVAATCLGVKNPDARSGGLDVSLFRRLSDAHPNSVVDLNQQYRMNEDIMLLSNKLIYDDRLRCGNESVKERRLELAEGAVKVLQGMHEGARRRVSNPCGGMGVKKCWLEHLVDPKTKAVFVDTDPLGDVAHDSRSGDLVQNVVEAELVAQFVETLVRCGVDGSSVGVITLYRQQVKVLARKLAERGGEEDGVGLGGVEVMTADKSQGRDKDCIVVSLVRSNVENQIGELVKDWRRMNVSFTRARSKLVIFGSRSTLRQEVLLSQFFELMEGKGWCYELPRDAHLMHGSVDGKDAGEAEDRQDQEFAAVEEEQGPVKKGKAVLFKRGSNVADEGKVKKVNGLLKGRPILQDLVRNET
ncbi:Dna2-domain-containing protein [Coprinopsis marcescibilis]|uniref:DNA replication ATP-dependent helicase/nuclease DNA2 n=1 Tax=Coprinopsis marcescibilis TaxID=230819 RepID=A0A5C3KTY8_COPMA|nr:Dna2-domain-containing protein [Coprinopsis marcescibilis]